MRHDGRDLDQLRPFSLEPGFIGSALGSVLVATGRTRVICTASREAKPPGWLTQGGWVTAEYAMLPRSSPERIERERRGPGGRSHEIQRLIGRSLRAVIDLTALGERSILIDCDVIQADAGTRCAAITGGYVALVLALETLRQKEAFATLPVTGSVAAVSAGIVGGKLALDLCYAEDHQAEVDMNVVMTGAGKLVEVQGTAEGKPFTTSQLNRLLELSGRGIRELTAMQRQTLRAAGVALGRA
jgi:ribonuclease PH